MVQILEAACTYDFYICKFLVAIPLANDDWTHHDVTGTPNIVRYPWVACKIPKPYWDNYVEYPLLSGYLFLGVDDDSDDVMITVLSLLCLSYMRILYRLLSVGTPIYYLLLGLELRLLRLWDSERLSPYCNNQCSIETVSSHHWLLLGELAWYWALLKFWI